LLDLHTIVPATLPPLLQLQVLVLLLLLHARTLPCFNALLTAQPNLDLLSYQVGFNNPRRPQPARRSKHNSWAQVDTNSTL
jgi:hypothetical protein